ncbi:unnamed protein product [Periconia digitata]|uniref:Uncharacterized protein n=1 Tax=Periconia digitata TaxID=1303443 RepID=A0A9W4U440_9PLEO|nr:unnamed protein product [Periconia digitata]
MRFSLAAATVFASLFIPTIASSCDEGPFISTSAGIPLSDNPSEQIFCSSKWLNGDVITGLRVWWAKFQIKGIQVRYASITSDGEWGAIHGQTTEDVDDYDEKTWDSNTAIGMKLYNNKPDDGDPMDAVGRIVVTIPGQEDWVVGGSKYNDDEIYVNAGSGRLLAVQGAAGGMVTSLSFKFLESSIMSLEMTDISFTEDPMIWSQEHKGMNPQVVTTSSWYKNLNKEGEPTLHATDGIAIDEKTTKELTKSTTNTFGSGITVSIGGGVHVPFLVDAEAEVETSISYSMETMASESETKEHGWIKTGTINGDVPPQKAFRCKFIAIVGTYDSPFEANVTAKLANGETFVYKNYGNFKSIGYANLQDECQLFDLEDVPPLDPSEILSDDSDDKNKRSTRLTRFIH